MNEISTYSGKGEKKKKKNSLLIYVMVYDPEVKCWSASSSALQLRIFWGAFHRERKFLFCLWWCSMRGNKVSKWYIHGVGRNPVLSSVRWRAHQGHRYEQHYNVQVDAF